MLLLGILLPPPLGFGLPHGLRGGPRRPREGRGPRAVPGMEEQGGLGAQSFKEWKSEAVNIHGGTTVSVSTLHGRILVTIWFPAAPTSGF